MTNPKEPPFRADLDMKVITEKMWNSEPLARRIMEVKAKRIEDGIERNVFLRRFLNSPSVRIAVHSHPYEIDLQLKESPKSQDQHDDLYSLVVGLARDVGLEAAAFYEDAEDSTFVPYERLHHSRRNGFYLFLKRYVLVNPGSEDL